MVYGLNYEWIKGRNGILMLFVQDKLSQYRNDTIKPAFLQTASKQVDFKCNYYTTFFISYNFKLKYP